MDRKTVLILLLIVLLALFMRVFYLVRGQFLTDTTMAAVLTMNQAIANGYTIHPDTLAGFPSHPYVFPEKGIVYFAILPYSVLSFLGLFNVMYLIKILFVFLATFTVYLFAKKITGNMEAAMLSVLLYAISQAGMYNEAFNRWAGDSFVPIILIFSVLMLVYLSETERSRRLRFMLISTIILASISLSIVLWNGGTYALAAFVFAAMAMLITYRVKRSSTILLILTVGILAGWIVLFLTPIHSMLDFTVNLSPSYILSQFIQVIGQVEPQAYQTAPAYNNYVLYPVWVILGFLGSFALAIITLLKYPFASNSMNKKKAFIAVTSLLLFGIPFAITSSRFNSLVYLPLAILGGASIALVKTDGRRNLKIMLAFIVPFILIFAFYQILYTQQYTGISQHFHTLLQHVKQYTPRNATFLNFDGDGTAIEYWGNRTVLTDTNIANNQTEIQDYYDFLYARAGNFTYLHKIRPDYLLIHQVPSINGDFNNYYNGSNIQYLIEWAFSKNPEFSYDGINFQLIYTDFSLVYINNGIILYKLSYNYT